jgi:hypothetical protein
VIDAEIDGAVMDKDLPFASSSSSHDQAEGIWSAVSSFLAATPKGPPASSPSLLTTVSLPPLVPDGPAPGGVVGLADHATTTPSGGEPQDSLRATSLASAEVDVEAAARHFSYVDRVTSTLRPYDLSAAPFASIAVEVYPLARTTLPVVRDLGLTGNYGRAVALASADVSGVRVGTSWQIFDVGLRQRVRLGRSVVLGIGAGYGGNAFAFDEPQFTAVLPSVDYRMLRGALDVRASFGAFSILAGGGYLDVLSVGALGTAFPRESVGGVEGRVRGAFMPMRNIEISMGLAYTRFFYSFNPTPGDAGVAGGALDQMGRLSLGVAYLL